MINKLPAYGIVKNRAGSSRIQKNHARMDDGAEREDLLLPTLLRFWRKRTGGQLKTWTTTTKADLDPNTTSSGGERTE